MTRERARIALVTGANKGLGFEVARQLGRLGMMVIVGARDPERGRVAVSRLVDDGSSVTMVHIDVTNRTTIEAAADDIRHWYGRLDVLVNNAGILQDRAPPSALDPDTLRRTYETNVFGPIAVIQLMLPLLRQSTGGRIVNVSSNMGSFAEQTDPSSPIYGKNLLAYNSSKAALNCATVQFAYELRDTPIKVNAAAPGHLLTDLTGPQAPAVVQNARRTAEEGAAIIVKLAVLPADGPSGGLFSDKGPMPW